MVISAPQIWRDMAVRHLELKTTPTTGAELEYRCSMLVNGQDDKPAELLANRTCMLS